VTLAGVAAMAAWGLVLREAPALVGPRLGIFVGSVLLAVPAMAALALLRSGRWRQTIALAPPSPRTLVLSVFLGGALWVLSIGLMELQSLALPPPPEYLALFRAIHEALAPRNALDAVVSVVVIAIAPGVGEELLTRGILLPSLLRVLRPSGAIWISAILFAVMHFDPYRFVFTLVIGLLLGVLRVRTGSLWPAIVAHVTLNTLTFLIAPLVDDPAQTTYTPQPLLGMACLFVGAAVAVPLLRALPVGPSVRAPE
jgi:membrane protease YdiL (CAAX protease family)